MAGLIRLPLHSTALTRTPAYSSNWRVRSTHLYKVGCVYARVTDNMPLTAELNVCGNTFSRST